MDNKEIKIVYMGTPEFAVNALEAIIGAGYDVVAC
ncbi:MAG TPA: methionyl-tRNA formyltransferase, partial [Lachnospiraceae bacterium]|nr:methionyl-tRNA formyltransferase [Lachnospiraceae bacterium]